jgi:hypothetical protein
MGFLFPKPPKIVAPPAPPAGVADPAVQAAQAAELERQKKRRGFAATILTSPQGVLGAAPTTKKTLLGS